MVFSFVGLKLFVKKYKLLTIKIKKYDTKYIVVKQFHTKNIYNIIIKKFNFLKKKISNNYTVEDLVYKKSYFLKLKKL